MQPFSSSRQAELLLPVLFHEVFTFAKKVEALKLYKWMDSNSIKTSAAAVSCAMLSSAVTAHLARAAGPGDLGAAPATAALLGLLREVLAGHSVAGFKRS